MHEARKLNNQPMITLVKFHKKNTKSSGENGTQPISSGKHTYGINNIRITWQGDATVTIGAFCSIAANVTIQLGGNHNLHWITTYPFGHLSNDPPFHEPILNHPRPSKNVEIGNDVWIGNNVTIMGGNSVGNGAVIAANSHVVTNVPPFEVWGGNPARKVMDRFPPEIKNRLIELEWWNLSDEAIATIIPLLTSEPSGASLNAIELLLSKSNLDT
jgi:acetyltransferase-like isoleucine patch superfamily enzyme